MEEVQKLARHSTSVLTLDVYTHIGLNDERRAMENLPELHRTNQKGRAVALKTGTDDTPIGATQNGQEKLTPHLTPKLTHTAFPAYDRSSAIGNERGTSSENDNSDNYSDGKHLDNKDDRLATVGVGKK